MAQAAGDDLPISRAGHDLAHGWRSEHGALSPLGEEDARNSLALVQLACVWLP
jgi:hypothetical protein